MLPISRAQGVHGTGGYTYTPEQMDLFFTFMQRHCGEERAVKIKVISEQTGIPGRTVRALASHLSGREGLIICSGNSGYFVAEFQEEVDRTLKRKGAQVRTELQRMRRERLACYALPKRVP